jgi:hypothetical protein
MPVGPASCVLEAAADAEESRDGVECAACGIETCDGEKELSGLYCTYEMPSLTTSTHLISHATLKSICTLAPQTERFSLLSAHKRGYEA